MKPEEIKELRSGMKLTQKAFAAKLSVSKDTVNRWENGRSPSEAMQARLRELTAGSIPAVSTVESTVASTAEPVAIGESENDG